MFVCENEKATDIIFTEKQDAEVFLSALCGFFLVDKRFSESSFLGKSDYVRKTSTCVKLFVIRYKPSLSVGNKRKNV